MLNINIKLESFEGPLDLLYKLIEKNKINIYDIPIVELTNQYLYYIDSFPNDIDSISEFLLMAATLLEIKSKMLLPKLNKNLNEEEDPREVLINKLVEYKKFKEISTKLQEKFLNTDIIIHKKQEKEVIDIIQKQIDNSMFEEITSEILLKIFLDIINRKELKIDKVRKSFNNIKRDKFTVEDKIKYIIYMVDLNEPLSLKKIFDNYIFKEEKVITFLAILELIKIKKIKVKQENIFEDIIISKY